MFKYKASMKQVKRKNNSLSAFVPVASRVQEKTRLALIPVAGNHRDCHVAMLLAMTIVPHRTSLVCGKGIELLLLGEHGADGESRMDTVDGLAEERSDRQHGDLVQLLVADDGHGVGDNDLFHR